MVANKPPNSSPPKTLRQKHKNKIIGGLFAVLTIGGAVKYNQNNSSPGEKDKTHTMHDDDRTTDQKHTEDAKQILDLQETIRRLHQLMKEDHIDSQELTFYIQEVIAHYTNANTKQKREIINTLINTIEELTSITKEQTTTITLFLYQATAYNHDNTILAQLKLLTNKLLLKGVNQEIERINNELEQRIITTLLNKLHNHNIDQIELSEVESIITRHVQLIQDNIGETKNDIQNNKLTNTEKYQKLQQLDQQITNYIQELLRITQMIHEREIPPQIKKILRGHVIHNLVNLLKSISSIQKILTDQLKQDFQDPNASIDQLIRRQKELGNILRGKSGYPDMPIIGLWEKCEETLEKALEIRNHIVEQYQQNE